MSKIKILLFVLNFLHIFCNSWCPHIPCHCIGMNSSNSRSICDVQLLLLVLPDLHPDGTSRSKMNNEIILNLQKYFEENNIELIFQNESILFSLSEIYFKIQRMQQKTLPAFIHDTLELNILQSAIFDIFSLTSKQSSLNSLQRLNFSSTSKIYVIISSVLTIQKYDILRKSFPCTRSILLKHKATTLLNVYILKFFPNSYIINNDNPVDLHRWLQSWIPLTKPKFGENNCDVSKSKDTLGA